MKVYNAFVKRPCIPSLSGRAEYVTHSLSFDSYGNAILIEKETRNRYQEIQSFKDECDIGLIVSRAVATGDTSILNKSNPFYGDFTGLPSTLAEMHKVMNKAHEMYNNLPSGSFEDFSAFLNSFSSIDNFKKSYFDFKKKDDTAAPTASSTSESTAAPSAESTSGGTK